MVPENSMQFAACQARYEAGRRSVSRVRTVAVLLFVALLAALEVWLGAVHVSLLLICGVVLSGVVYGASVRGVDAWRGARLGALAGLLPLAASLGSEQLGMVCTPAGCSSLCVPACVASGVLAALVIAQQGRARRASREFYLSAGITATAMGGLGCACVGYTGALALAAAMFVALGTSAVLAPRPA